VLVIAGVRGVIASIEPSAIVVDLHGFLMRVNTSARTAERAGTPGDPIELVTHLIVREDALTLYGFTEQAELDLFQLLLTVSGVGPRVALSMLSFDEPGTIYEAIANDDVKLLSKVPGIGKKTAEQIIFHLKRKLPEYHPTEAGPVEAPDREALAALEALGYSLIEARSALGAIEGRTGMSVEERVFNALQRLGNA
jgi:Holliday junction DNA helicase RuvA